MNLLLDLIIQELRSLQVVGLCPTKHLLWDDTKFHTGDFSFWIVSHFYREKTCYCLLFQLLLYPFVVTHCFACVDWVVCFFICFSLLIKYTSIKLG